MGFNKASVLFGVLALVVVSQAQAGMGGEPIGSCNATEADGRDIPRVFELKHVYPAKLNVVFTRHESALFDLGDASLLSSSLGVLTFMNQESNARLVLTPTPGGGGAYTGSLVVPMRSFQPARAYALHCTFHGDGLSWFVATQRRMRDHAGAVSDDVAGPRFVPPAFEPAAPASTPLPAIRRVF